MGRLAPPSGNEENNIVHKGSGAKHHCPCGHKYFPLRLSTTCQLNIKQPAWPGGTV
jgi:hypothetical protein